MDKLRGGRHRNSIKVVHANGKIFVNANQIYEKFFCDPYDLTKWRKEGMPFIKVDGAYYYNIEDCQAWFRGEETHKKSANSSADKINC
ncbi:hypothetical protein [Petroclostridium sp. X23]|uniref:hypothetical protein n=1 Tax=Petroclostridium sp. X23 TaxID=3045146 RepID=UPI0024AE7DA0|nr:hypothetical protein [Petroclostridium sp. X23]WHH59123.1 hypothetical protein QKW49_25615 [Petroclostridium sp. X23]